MNDQNQTKYKYAVVSVCVLLCAVLFLCFYAYYAGTTDADYNDVAGTVQQIKDNNDDARSDIGSARTEIESAGSELDRATTDVTDAQQSVERLQDSVSDNQRAISESRNLIATSRQSIERERSIFTEIDAANPGAQTSLSR